ncbi:MAG TPA: hypothetical protein VHT70_05405 [Candidatus Saccharimonadales bacterium]|nr:hypothetical protein [Candidatus Saccharimonadales bacterium]
MSPSRTTIRTAEKAWRFLVAHQSEIVMPITTQELLEYACMLDALHTAPAARSYCRVLAERMSDLKSILHRLLEPPMGAVPSVDVTAAFWSLTCLWQYDASIIDATWVARVAKFLPAIEQGVGGPYLVLDTAGDRSVDPLANAAIAAFLRCVAQPLPSLIATMNQAFVADGVMQPFTLYVLSAACGDELDVQLRAALAQARAATPLEASLLGLASRRLDMPLPASLQRLLADMQQTDGSWRHTEAWGLRWSNLGITALASGVLPQADVHDAMQDMPTIPASQDDMQLYRDIFIAARRELDALDPRLRHAASTMLATIKRVDKSHEIALLAAQFGQSLRHPPAHARELYVRLGVANIYNWMAYTLYDDLLDKDGELSLLPAANVALRLAVRRFWQAVPRSTAFRSMVDTAFDVVDSANAWELAHCRALVTGGRITLDALPRFGHPPKLAARSCTHMLPMLGVLAHNGLQPGSPAAQTMQHAITQYLVARQLSDDLRDWEQDLLAGQLSYVAVTLLRQVHATTGTFELAALLPPMRQQFWHHTLATLCKEVLAYTAKARELTAQSQLFSVANGMTALTAYIDASIRRTQADHANAQQFIQTYQT